MPAREKVIYDRWRKGVRLATQDMVSLNVREGDVRRTFKLDRDIAKDALERIVLDLYVLCLWAGVTTGLLGWTPRAARKAKNEENQ